MDSQKKLPPKHTTFFKKKPSISLASTKMREDTVFKKALELSIMCDIQLCALYYSRDGELVKTYPDDQTKVRDITVRFSQLSDGEKRKKSSNLFDLLKKKMNEEKKANPDKFTQKPLGLEGSVKTGLQMFQEKIWFVTHRHVRIFHLLHLINKYHRFPTALSNHPSNCSIYLYNHDNATVTQLASSCFDPPDSFADPIIFSSYVS